MRYVVVGVVLASILIGAGLALCDREDKSESAPRVPAGWVAVRESDWNLFRKEPAACFRRAYDKYLRQDTEDAAVEVRKAAIYIAVEANRAEKDISQQLAVCVRELRSLAGKMETGMLRPDALRNEFARAEYALAVHYDMRGEAYQKDKNIEHFSAAVEASAFHLLHATTWADETLDPKDFELIQAARKLAKRTGRDATEMSEEAKSRRARMGHVLKKVGSELKEGWKRGMSEEREPGDD